MDLPMPGGEYIFALVDYFSRFLEVVVLQSVTSKDIISAIQPIFAVHGLPVSVKTDNGRHRDIIVYRDIITSPMIQVRTQYRALYLNPISRV